MYPKMVPTWVIVMALSIQRNEAEAWDWVSQHAVKMRLVVGLFALALLEREASDEEGDEVDEISSHVGRLTF